MESTLAVQQFIQQMVRRNPSAVDAILTPPKQQDEGVWKYEHLRYVNTQQVTASVHHSPAFGYSGDRAMLNMWL